LVRLLRMAAAPDKEMRKAKAVRAIIAIAPTSSRSLVGLGERMKSNRASTAWAVESTISVTDALMARRAAMSRRILPAALSVAAHLST